MDLSPKGDLLVCGVEDPVTSHLGLRIYRLGPNRDALPKHSSRCRLPQARMNPRRLSIGIMHRPPGSDAHGQCASGARRQRDGDLLRFTLAEPDVSQDVAVAAGRHVELNVLVRQNEVLEHVAAVARHRHVQKVCQSECDSVRARFRRDSGVIGVG